MENDLRIEFGDVLVEFELKKSQICLEFLECY